MLFVLSTCTGAQRDYHVPMMFVSFHNKTTGVTSGVVTTKLSGSSGFRQLLVGFMLLNP